MMNRDSRSVAIACSVALGVLLILPNPAAVAHGGATGIVKERMDGMTAMAKSMKTLGAMFKGQRDYDAEQVHLAAESISAHAREIPALFPDRPDSRAGKHSAALPVIWDEKDRFDGLAEALLAESEALAAVALAPVARGGDKRSVRKQFARTARACSGCHTAFRRPES